MYSFERYLIRCLSVKCELYSEMMVSETLLYSVYGEDILEYGVVVELEVALINASILLFASWVAEILIALVRQRRW